MRQPRKCTRKMSKFVKRPVRSSGSRIMMHAGAPMIIFILGGSFALSTFMQTHYDIKDKASNTQTTRKFDLDEEHAAMMKKLDIANFSLSRIPRPEELDAAALARKEIKEKKKWSPKSKYTANLSLNGKEVKIEDNVPSKHIEKE